MASIYQQSYLLHREWHPQVRELSGCEFGAQAVDRLFLADSNEEMQALEELGVHYEAQQGFSARLLAPAEFTRLDARLQTGWRGGLLTRGNMRLHAELYRQALLGAACKLGARVVRARVERIEAEGDTVDSVSWSEGQTAVDGLCMATGAWNGGAIDGWDSTATVPVTPLVGDLLLVDLPGRPLEIDVSHGLTAIYQHQGNRYWIGGSERRDGPLGAIPDAAREALVTGAAKLVCGAESWRVIRGASAARPTTPDRLPVVGRAPAYSNGWIINGGGGKGILMSAWMAVALAKMIATDETPAEVHFLSPSRATA